MPTNAWRRHGGKAAVAVALAGAVLAASACGEATRSSSAADPAPSAAIAKALDDVVRAGFPGAQVVISGPGGQRTMTAGVGDLRTGAPIAQDAQVRIGSNTKTFVATVLLQLVAEGKVQLDAPVERYLPGVVHGNGNDGNRVTVRQLLQHTSGLPEYLASGDPSVAPDPNSPQLQVDSEAVRWRHYDDAGLVRIAMSLPPRFEPGARQVYTNTNYILLGMLIERVTGQPVATEITRRVIEPLGLRATYFPAAEDTGIRDPHPVGYQETDGQRVDFTAQNTTWAGAAGAMISTGAELNKFFTALLRGELLPADQLAEMKKTVPFDRMPGGGYGLGLVRYPTACKEMWGHGGSIPGFETRDAVAADGTAVTLTVNQLPASQQSADVVVKAFDAIACAA
ncbi:serine hydrolase domain-containing protein [Nocardia sp. NPDC052566]|uniref:serine hydrolase domain-containing protein n=1 Tax=Nocardia sp. NPDC052566 TaxID=3364330 RepID=UPI0037C731F6